MQESINRETHLETAMPPPIVLPRTLTLPERAARARAEHGKLRSKMSREEARPLLTVIRGLIEPLPARPASTGETQPPG
jgi:hypothetical protein